MKIPTLVQSIESIVVSDGNGAREALNQFAPEWHGKVSWADWVLLELAARGFQVVPIEEKDLSWP